MQIRGKGGEWRHKGMVQKHNTEMDRDWKMKRNGLIISLGLLMLIHANVEV